MTHVIQTDLIAMSLSLKPLDPDRKRNERQGQGVNRTDYLHQTRFASLMLIAPGSTSAFRASVREGDSR